MPGWARRRRISALPAIPMWCRWAKAGSTIPSQAEIADGMLYGRGAADMKSAIAAFVAAAARIGAHPLDQGLDQPADHRRRGRPRHQRHAQAAGLAEGQRGENIDHCVVGEPTSVARAGDTLKIGRRGSINFRITVHGRAGPCRLSAKGEESDSRRWRELVTQLAGAQAGQGQRPFRSSTLAFTSVDVGNRRHQCDSRRGARRLQHPLQ